MRRRRNPPSEFMGYRVSSHSGTITQPGKFEGEMYYVPFFWNVVMEGFAEDMSDGSARVELEAEDWQKFPETRGFHYIRLYESDQGFVFAKLTRKKKK